MAGEKLQGRRRAAKVNVHEFKPGDYQLNAKGEVWFCDPNGNVGHLVRSTWTMTVHEDNTITAAPSIFCNRGRPTEWHGYLERGVWRSV